MQEMDFSTEEISFWELLKQTKIEIPIIQRDYAQGRKGEEKVRQNFLKAIFSALTSSNSLELDFIYGSKESGALQPLDGQQRLTTLFLIHWYLACKEGIAFSYMSIFKNLTYETRASSRLFCESIAENPLDFDRLLAADKNKHNRISKTITDSAWFFLAWRKDPTIRAMLNMLDDIDTQFGETGDLWSALSKTGKIVFHYIELRNFGLSDDLYIKMNARGKALTTFENLKAKLERYIGQVGWEDDVDYQFAQQVDTNWADMFWSRIDDPNQIDNAFMKYLSGIAMIRYARNQRIYSSAEDVEKTRHELTARGAGKVTDEAVRRTLVEKRIEELLNQPDSLEPQDFFQKEDFEYLKDSLAIYSRYYKEFGCVDIGGLDFWEYTTQYDLFYEFAGPKGLTTYKQRVLFYAQTTFLMSGNQPGFAFYNWLRVVRNIVENSTIDSAGSFIGAIGLVRELSTGCANIYGYLSDNKVQSNFADKQMTEERTKAIVLEHYKLSQTAFHEMEDTNFCRGRITFGLYCLELDRPSLMPHLDQINRLTSVFNTYMSDTDITNVFRRALLSIGDNHCYHYWSSWSYNTNTTKRCLIENMADLKGYAYSEGVRHYLASLMHELWSKTPQQIVDDFVPQSYTHRWITRLIKEPDLLNKHGQSKYFGLTADEKRCYLYNVWKRPSSLDDCFEIK